MVLCDVNVLVYAYREAAPGHPRFRAWLEELVGSRAPYAVSDLVLSGFIRVATHPKVFSPPTPVDAALEFAAAFRARENAVPVAPGRRHWTIFTELCEEVEARGNLVPDAFLAALAIETGSELATSDRDFSRFPGLRWSHPLS